MNRISNYKSDFFKEIDSELKAYILGYIVADGCITIEDRKDRPSKIKRVQFQPTIDDLFTILIIRNAICPLNKITLVKSKSDNRKDTIKLRIANREIVDDLINLYNIFPRKTFNSKFQFPNIKKEFKRHFIRGFMDGDGSIGKRHFSMVCNSKIFAEQIKNEFLDYDPTLRFHIYTENRKKTVYYSLHFNVNIKSRVSLHNYLYKDADYFLKRKYDKSLNAVLNSKSKELLSV